MGSTKGLWDYLADMAPQATNGQRGDWNTSLRDLEVALHSYGFPIPVGQLELELERVPEGFQWKVTKHDGKYHFNLKH